MKGGVPPTARNARTGLFTPPTMSFWARSKMVADLEWFMGFRSILVSPLVIVDRTAPLFDQVQRLGARPAQARKAREQLRGVLAGLRKLVEAVGGGSERAMGLIHVALLELEP